MEITLETETISFGKETKVEYRLLLKDRQYAIYAKLSGSAKTKDYEMQVNDITTIKEYAKEIFDEIVKNKVSPCHLCDVIIDKICI